MTHKLTKMENRKNLWHSVVFSSATMFAVVALVLLSAGHATASANGTDGNMTIVLPAVPEVNNSSASITKEDLDALSKYQDRFMDSLDNQQLAHEQTDRLWIVEEHGMLKSLFDNLPKIIGSAHEPKESTVSQANSAPTLSQSPTSGSGESTSWGFGQILVLLLVFGVAVVAIAVGARH